MRQSIQQDEQAIESLVRQATTLETMINWSLLEIYDNSIRS